jgi:hypothetical protein
MQTTKQVDLIDRELRCHGTSASAWAERYGLTCATLGQMIEQPAAHPVVLDLAEFLGVSSETLRAC